MAAYVIADLTITDPEGFRAYQQRVGATLAPFGGIFLVRGGAHETMEGEWHPQTLVISAVRKRRPGLAVVSVPRVYDFERTPQADRHHPGCRRRGGLVWSAEPLRCEKPLDGHPRGAGSVLKETNLSAPVSTEMHPPRCCRHGCRRYIGAQSTAVWTR